jgi:hypothetical protein
VSDAVSRAQVGPERRLAVGSRRDEVEPAQPRHDTTVTVRVVLGRSAAPSSRGFDNEKCRHVQVSFISPRLRTEKARYPPMTLSA